MAIKRKKGPIWTRSRGRNGRFVKKGSGRPETARRYGLTNRTIKRSYKIKASSMKRRKYKR